MKKISLFIVCVCFLVSVFALEQNGLNAARELADRGIIVDQSSMAQKYRINSSLDLQESAMYRLDDELIRQEALGIALKIRGTTLPDTYTCRKYFRDISESWVCRAAELSADMDLVTRANLDFRPYDSLTLAEGLAIAMKARGFALSTAPTTDMPGTLPIWQKRLIQTIQNNSINMDIRDANGQSIAVYDTRFTDGISGFAMSHRLTRGQFFQIVIALMDHEEAGPVTHCVTYNDGCNDCTRMADGGAACTKRACIWQGIPKCYTCEEWYTLEGDRCVRAPVSCVAEGGYAGGGHVMWPENPDDFMCCAGLSKSERADGSTFADAGYTCIRQGDQICDARYENDTNSADCRDATAFDSAVCSAYFDGCNSCSVTENGTVCTLKYCAVNGPAYCTEYRWYGPANQTVDGNFLSKVSNELRHYTADLTCTTDAQCQWAMVGNKACGGPTAAIAFSTKNVDATLVSKKDTYITNAEKLFNQTYGLMSDCSLLIEPAAMTCQSGVCK